MKKKRGLKRYYRNLSNLTFIDNLNFSNNDDSWFDFYHIHIDNTGLGNSSWKSRVQHLNALFEVATKIETKLKYYNKDYQYWIQISEIDSYEDSIYIHTKNPNKSKFPEKINFDSNVKIKNEKLDDFIASKGYKIGRKILINYKGEKFINYFLHKKTFGIEL